MLHTPVTDLKIIPCDFSIVYRPHANKVRVRFRGRVGLEFGLGFWVRLRVRVRFIDHLTSR
jgi:hypothetical protein